MSTLDINITKSHWDILLQIIIEDLDVIYLNCGVHSLNEISLAILYFKYLMNEIVYFCDLTLSFELWNAHHYQAKILNSFACCIMYPSFLDFKSMCWFANVLKWLVMLVTFPKPYYNPQSLASTHTHTYTYTNIHTYIGILGCHFHKVLASPYFH